jgi:chromosome segregation ATPase
MKINKLEAQLKTACQIFDTERLQLRNEIDSRASQSSLECERLKLDFQRLSSENYKLKNDLHTQAEVVHKLRIESEAKFHSKSSALDEARIELENSRQSKGMDSSELDEARQQSSLLQDEIIELQNIIAQHDLEEEYQRLAKASASSSDPLRTPFIAGPSTSSEMGYADAIP